MPTSEHPPAEEAALSLALALVASSAAPLLLLDGELKVIAASASFCRAFDVDPATVHGCSLADLGAPEWARPQLRFLLEETAAGQVPIESYEMDLDVGGQHPRRLVIQAQKLDYWDRGKVRLLVTVADVTEGRLADKLRDDLMRDRAVLLQEVRHRVANSLQVVASVLMQSARKTASEEARAHLKAAHNRVMSVAALQRELSTTSLADVELRAYFNRLCASIGASMIQDKDQVSLTVETDDSIVYADVSVSLGLIATELVINALKHAFPGGGPGAIVVGYQSEGASWTLSVTDNGVGLATGAATAKAGLGTSIVQALAHQLDATVITADAQPGAKVMVHHASGQGAGPAGHPAV